MKKTIDVKGTMQACLLAEDGRIIEVSSGNMILNGGFELIAKSIITGERPQALSHIAVGTGSAAVKPNQAGLTKEISRKPAAATYDVNSKSITFTAEFNEDVTGAIVEAGVCNAESGGIFLDRTVFPVLNKEADDELVIKFIISFDEA